MDHLPVGSLLTLVVTDVFVMLLLSVVCGFAVARGAGRSLARGVATGLLAPVVGPYVWGIAATGRRRELARIRRLAPRPAVVYATTACLVLAAGVFLVGMVAPWGHVSGGYQDYAFASNASAVDTGVGFVASLLTALAALVAAAATLGWTPWHRAAVALVTVASVWILSCLDGLIVFHAIGDVTKNVEGVSGGRADAAASAGAGLWLAFLGAVLMTIAAVLLAARQRAEPGFAAVEPTPLSASAPAPVAVPQAGPSDWGDDWGTPAPAAPATGDTGDWGDWGDPDNGRGSH